MAKKNKGEGNIVLKINVGVSLDQEMSYIRMILG